MTRHATIVLALLIATHLAVAAAFPQMIKVSRDTKQVEYALLGIIISQVNLIAMWAVFSPGPVARRWPWAMLLGIVMWAALVISNRFAFSLPRQEALKLGAVILAGIVVAQIPLWVIRQFWHYRLYPPRYVDRDEQQFSLAQLLTGIALCCIGLALVQAVLPNRSGTWGADPFWQMIAVFSMIAIVNLVVTLPCMWVALGFTFGQCVLLSVVFVGYSYVVTQAELAALEALEGSGPPPDGFTSLWLLNFAQGMSIGITLGILRAAGFNWKTSVAPVPRSKQPLD